MAMVQGREALTVWVVFQGADHRRPWRIFTKRKWRHVFLIKPAYYPEPSLMADAYSVIVNPVLSHIDVDVAFVRPEFTAQDCLEAGATCVIKMRIDRKPNGSYVPRGIQSCVSIVKSILGISAWYVWTPEHLARWMLRNGGKLVTREPTNERTLREKTNG